MVSPRDAEETTTTRELLFSATTVGSSQTSPVTCSASSSDYTLYIVAGLYICVVT